MSVELFKLLETNLPGLQYLKFSLKNGADTVNWGKVIKIQEQRSNFNLWNATIWKQKTKICVFREWCFSLVWWDSDLSRATGIYRNKLVGVGNNGQQWKVNGKIRKWHSLKGLKCHANSLGFIGWAISWSKTVTWSKLFQENNSTTGSRMLEETWVLMSGEEVSLDKS